MQARTTRRYIVEAADTLFYQKGFEHTSFADIASAVNISRGNFYYHFKTKDEILDAVIDRRVSDTHAMLDEWTNNSETPMERIRSFIGILIRNRVNIRQFGCPVGTLCSELNKLHHPAQKEANHIFTLFRLWLRKAFSDMGLSKKDADANAMHVLAFSQGVATLASAFGDERFIRQEVRQKTRWLKAIEKAALSSNTQRKKKHKIKARR